MMLIPTLLLLLAGAPQQAADARAEAERLAQAGSHAEALARFQAIVAANPDDVPARLWIARLHVSMGHPARAASVFESIVATQPQNVDALLGLGLALGELNRWTEAGDALARAEALAADRVDVLAAQGRFHGASGRRTLGLAYYARALAADPTNARIRADALSLRATRAHRIEADYDFQSFDPSSGRMNAGSIEANLRVNDGLRVFARGQFQSFRDEDDLRGGAGVEWLIGRGLVLRGGALVGSDNVWLPDVDGFADLAFTRGRTRLTAMLRVLDFAGAEVWIGGPGLAHAISPRVTLHGQYRFARTGFDAGVSRTSNGVTLGLTAQLGDTVEGTAEYSRGYSSLDWFTSDRVGADTSNSWGAAVAWRITPLTSLGARYELEDRAAGFRAHRARARFTYRF